MKKILSRNLFPSIFFAAIFFPAILSRHTKECCIDGGWRWCLHVECETLCERSHKCETLSDDDDEAANTYDFSQTVFHTPPAAPTQETQTVSDDVIYDRGHHEARFISWEVKMARKKMAGKKMAGENGGKENGGREWREIKWREKMEGENGVKT